MTFDTMTHDEQVAEIKGCIDDACCAGGNPKPMCAAVDRWAAISAAAHALLAEIGPTDDDMPGRLRPYTLALRVALPPSSRRGRQIDPKPLR